MARERGDTSHGLRALREENARRILRTLLDNPAGVTQMEIAEATQLARSTVSMLLSETLQTVLTYRERAPAERGPRPRFWTIAPEAAYSLGLDIGKSHITTALANPYGELVSGPYVVEMDTKVDPDQVLDIAGDKIEWTIRTQTRCRRIAAVMVGLPGVTDAENGLLLDPMAPRWAKYKVPQAIERRWPLDPVPPVFVENDANLGALGELHKGAGREVNSLLFIKWSTGIGSGLVINGKLWRGKTGGAGELGHLRVHPTDKDREVLKLPRRSEMAVCPRCEQRDCLERIASGQALAEALEVKDFRAVVRQAQDPNPEMHERARAAINVAAKMIGTAIGPVLTMLNVERVIVGGIGGDDAYRLAVKSIREGLDQTAPAKARTDAEIMPSKLGSRAYVVGAAITAFEKQGVDFLYRSSANSLPKNDEYQEGTVLAG